MRLWTALMLAGFAACGDDDGSMPGADAGLDAGAAATWEDVCREFSEVTCAGLEACGCRFDIRPYDAATCVTARTETCVANLPAAVADDLAAGRADIDEASLARCLADFGAVAAACDRGQLPASCRDFLLSSAALGEMCTLAGGGLAFCAAGDGVCEPESGACTELPAAGAPCLGGELCTRGLVCRMGTCDAAVGDGGACDGLPVCEAGLVCHAEGMCGAPRGVAGVCGADEQCAEGLWCDGGACAMGVAVGELCSGPPECGAQRSCQRAPETRVCSTPDASGEMCTPETCADGLGCAESTTTCVDLPGDGQTCLDGFSCETGFTCVDGAGTCAALPGVGQACAVGNRFCADGLGCRQSTNTCELPAALGEECLLNPPDYVCADGLGCDFAAQGSVCIAKGGEGATCSNDTVCAAGTYCEFSELVCRARRPAGAACEDGNECELGMECEFVGGVAQCRAIPAAGEPCASACVAGQVCKGPGGECAPAFCTISG